MNTVPALHFQTWVEKTSTNFPRSLRAHRTLEEESGIPVSSAVRRRSSEALDTIISYTLLKHSYDEGVASLI